MNYDEEINKYNSIIGQLEATKSVENFFNNEIVNLLNEIGNNIITDDKVILENEIKKLIETDNLSSKEIGNVIIPNLRNKIVELETAKAAELSALAAAAVVTTTSTSTTTPSPKSASMPISRTNA